MRMDGPDVFVARVLSISITHVYGSGTLLGFAARCDFVMDMTSVAETWSTSLVKLTILLVAFSRQNCDFD